VIEQRCPPISLHGAAVAECSINIESWDLLGLSCIYRFLQTGQRFAFKGGLAKSTEHCPFCTEDSSDWWSTYFLLAYALSSLFIPPALVFHKKATFFRENSKRRLHKL